MTNNGSSDGDNPTRMTGRVKWFDPVKGYGFIAPVDGGKDILLHISALRDSGFGSIIQDARIECDVISRDRGAQAVRIITVDESDVTPVFTGAGGSAEIDLTATDISEELYPARVKWFDKNKGFGFVNVLADPEDVFVHMQTLRRYGLPHLDAGEAILIRTGIGERGKMAVEIRPWDFACGR